MLQLMLPSVRVVVGRNASAPTGCSRIKGRGPGAYFTKEESAGVLRSTALARCGLARRRAAQPPREAVLMPRAGVGLQSGSRRNFDEQAALEATLRREVEARGGTVRVVPTPGGDAALCEQVALWARPDLVLTPNGAHFVNAIFMREGATLLEGVPWAMANYSGQLAITRHSGLVHLRLHSERPPTSSELGGFAQLSEAECGAQERCQHRYRDRADIHVTPRELRRALAEAALASRGGPVRVTQWGAVAPRAVGRGGAAARGAARTTRRGASRGGKRGASSGCTDAPGWRNPYGRGCRDYARRAPASAEGDSSPAAGGWCEGGRLKSSSRWAGGARYDWPERHCCACGRGGFLESSELVVGHGPLDEETVT